MNWKTMTCIKTSVPALCIVYVIYNVVIKKHKIFYWVHFTCKTEGPWATISTFVQSYVYTVTLKKRQKIIISFLRFEWSFIHSLHTRMLCAKLS